MTGKMVAFCRAYARLQDVAKAALEAGYSKTYATQKAWQLLQRDDVQAEIKRLAAKIEDRAVKQAVDVVNQFSVIAFCDPVSFLTDDELMPGQKRWKTPDELTPEQRMCIKDIRTYVLRDKDGNFIRMNYSYILKDSERAAENLARHYGVFDTKTARPNAENPLAGLPTEKLLRIKQAIARVMAEPDGHVIEGTVIDGSTQRTHLLPDGKGR